MFIPENFWHPSLKELPLENNDNSNNDIESSNKIYLISSDQNSYEAENPREIMWSRVNRVFQNACQWIYNSKSNKYHIAVRLSDFYFSGFDFVNKVLPFLPKNAQEELIRQNFINIPLEAIEASKKGNPMLSMAILFERNLLNLHTRPLDQIKPNDMRLYLNYLKKCKSDQPEAMWQLYIQNNVIGIINGLVSNYKTNPKLIFSGFLSKFDDFPNQKFFIEKVFKENAFFLNPEYAFQTYQNYLPFIVIRENVFKKQDQAQYKLNIDQLYPVTHFPSVISDLVTSYIQYENLETFLLHSTSTELESFVIKCMSWLEFFEQLSKFFKSQ